MNNVSDNTPGLVLLIQATLALVLGGSIKMALNLKSNRYQVKVYSGINHSPQQLGLHAWTSYEQPSQSWNKPWPSIPLCPSG